jgi:hypothetical protein
MGFVALWELIKSLWFLATSRVGLPLIVAAVIIVLYEGLPIGPLRYIPYAGPYFAMVFDGRVDRVRASARSDVENEARAQAMALIEKKSKNHDEISTFDAAKLCGELGGRWVPNESRCD